MKDEIDCRMAVWISEISSGVRKVRAVAASKYGKELETEIDKTSGEPCWRFQSARSAKWMDHNPFWWRLDVYHSGINGHSLFNLISDCTDDTIQMKLTAMDISIEEVIKDNPNRPLPCTSQLGLATTRELINEIAARFEMQCDGGLDYKTYDPEKAA